MIVRSFRSFPVVYITPPPDKIFAKMLKDAGLMEERDYRTYLELFNNMANFMRKPNLIIHLDVTPEESLRRIKQRGRTMELGITIDYLNDLHRAYEEFIGNISRVIPVIKVNWTTFADPSKVAQLIKDEWTKMQSIHQVDFFP